MASGTRLSDATHTQALDLASCLIQPQDLKLQSFSVYAHARKWITLVKGERFVIEPRELKFVLAYFALRTFREHLKFFNFQRNLAHYQTYLGLQS